MTEKEVNKQEKWNLEEEGGGGVRLADKAGKALQVSPAPLLCK